MAPRSVLPLREALLVLESRIPVAAAFRRVPNGDLVEWQVVNLSRANAVGRLTVGIPWQAVPT